MSALDAQEVVKFLQQTLPFQSLSQAQLNQMIRALDVRYIRRSTTVDIGSHTGENEFSLGLYLIRRGAFEISTPHHYLIDKIADGECFGISSLLENNPEGLIVSAIEDSLVYVVPKQVFIELTQENEEFARYFNLLRDRRLHRLSARDEHVLSKPTLQVSIPLKKLMSLQPVTISPEESIHAAAIKMSEARVSSILVIEKNAEKASEKITEKEMKKDSGGKLIGIVTDRDLRSRVVACSLPVESPIKTIMTDTPLYLDETASSLTAQLVMSKHNVHHLPIVNNKHQPIGLLSSTDLLRSQALSPLLIVSELNRQNDVAGLQVVAKRIPELIINLTLSETNPSEIGEVLAAITDNLTRCLIKMALQEYGEAPMSFNFLVFGSQARKDQSLGSDQDNALLLERPPNEEESLYFKQLASFICGGLNACGIPYCPGNIMASNPDYRLTQEQWQQKFAYWIVSNSPQSLLQASIFFDIRSVYGDKSNLAPLTQLIQTKAKKNSIFLATLTNNAVSAKPPLGFFRNFVLEHTGEHKNKLDLKHQGLALINDLARIYSFSCDGYQATTLQRLERLADKRLLGRDYINNLKDAWLYLSSLRYETQQRHWQREGKSSAFLDPSTLSPLQRQHLKLTFKSIAKAQDITHGKYAKGLG
ncbi:CBS domain-containing protein [Marinomonas agarivorans]|nr:CBS domain-containing protein [Marinomonas agarivorans]